MSARLVRVAAGASTTAGALLWILAPKCPLCIAAWLAGAGIGAEYAAALAPLLRPTGTVLLVTAALFALVGFMRRYRARGSCSCAT